MKKLVKDELFADLVGALLDKTCQMEPVPMAMQSAEREVALIVGNRSQVVREKVMEKGEKKVWEVRYRFGKEEERSMRMLVDRRIDAWKVAAHLRYRVAEQLKRLELYEEVDQA